MTQFEKKKISELKKLKLEEIEKYYLELRRYEFENNIPLKNMELRRLIHPLLLNIIKIDRLLSKETLTIINDRRIPTDKTRIYACTHIGGNDVQRAFEAIKEHAYLFIGDLKELYIDITGKILDLNGAVCLDTSNKLDRHIAYERAVEVLKRGYNLLIYPEGAWNITENFPIMGLYSGIFHMASETKSDIIPVAIEQYDKDFVVNIGENIRYNPFVSDDTKEMKYILKTALATLKWEIWEYYGGLRSSGDFSQEERNNFQQNIIQRCPYDFSAEDVYKTMYKEATSEYLREQFKLSRKQEN